MDHFTQIKDELKNVGCDFGENVSLKELTSFKIGGATPLLIKPQSTDKLAAALDILNKYRAKRFILGNGSNLLVCDEGVDYPVITLTSGAFTAVEVDGDRIVCGAGALLSSVCRTAYKHSLTGLEFAYGIPGSVGGAVFMNAGAYGGEVCQVLESVEYADTDGQLHNVSVSECGLGYRQSVFMTNGTVITKAVFHLSAGKQEDIKAAMDDFISRRKSKQPLEYPSAGSTFKRPEGYFAGALIEQAGLKGYTVGGAQVSEKHAGFVINIGHATASDVTRLMADVRETVLRKFGVALEPEIRFVD